MSNSLSSTNNTLIITSKRRSLLPNINTNKILLNTINNNNLPSLEINSNRNNIKRTKSYINNQPITDFTNRKILIKNSSFIIKDNKTNKKENIEKNYSHNTIITNLLNNAKNFFDNLGNYLEVNKPKEIPYLNANKIYPKLSNVKKKDILFPKKLKNKETDISKLYGRMYSLRILNDDNIKNNKTSHNISNISNGNYNDYNNENNNNIIVSKKYYISKKNKKLVNDEIIQTFNTQNKISEEKNDINDQNDNSNTNPINIQEIYEIPEKQKHIFNNNINNKKIFPSVYIPKFLNIERNTNNNNKNDVKIAEIREVYPSYPYNRLININSNRTDKRKNKFNKFHIDLKYNFETDSRYYYEKLMKNIKYGTNDKRENSSNNYLSNKYTKKINSNNKVKKIFI